MTRTLIVNADDFGLTPAVSQGILRAHRDGIVSSTSVLTIAPGFAPSAVWLRDTAGIGVGVHLAAVGEDPPLLSAREIPTLVNARGYLPISWRQLAARLAARRVDPGDVAREWSAQIDAARHAGLNIDHLDSHQHVHLFPGLAGVTVELAQRHGIGAVRVTRSVSRGPAGRAVALLARRFAIRARAASIATPDDAAGLDEAGCCDLDAIVNAIRRLAAGGANFAELSGHPGEHDDADRHRYAWNYRWGDELDAFCSPVVRAALDRSGFALGTYGDLAASVGEPGIGSDRP